MRNKLRVLGTKTARESSVTIASTAISGSLGLLFFMYLARRLGPTEYGFFSVTVAMITLLSDVSDVGLNTGIVRFVAKYFESDRSKALKILKLSLELKAVIGVMVLIVGFFVMPTVASSLLGKPSLTPHLTIGLFGVIAALLFSFSANTLQATQRFRSWAYLNIGSNSGRLMGVIVLALAGYLSAYSSLFLYVFFPFFLFVLSLTTMPPFLAAKDERSVLPEIASFNKWIALFVAMSAISSRLDTLITTRLLAIEEVGIYSVAVTLTSVIPQIVYAIAVVVAPKLSRFETKAQAYIYLKKVQLMVFVLAVAGVFLAIPVGFIGIPLLYGEAYTASFGPYVVLLLAQALFLISIPAHSAVLYYFSYPKLFVYLSLGHLAIIGIGGYVAISAFGIIGAAAIVLVGNIWNLTVPMIWSLRRFA